MNIAFRADASIQIGTGHVMRCLTLAEELRRQGHSCLFICRDHSGHLGEQIESKGFDLHLLTDTEHVANDDHDNQHASWPGAPWQQDARQTLEVLTPLSVDWLVVDHYALDARWERKAAAAVGRIMVIDDLADREHECSLLLDQNLGRKRSDYDQWVLDSCMRLIGPHYALLRPEFAMLRQRSLKRRQNPELKRILISLGGVDNTNVTGKVLDALTKAPLTQDIELDIIMGSAAPYLEDIRQQAAQLPCRATVSVNVSDMAERMCAADLSIGAAGSTSWERCCLGLPSIIVVLAENQLLIANALEKNKAALQINNFADISTLLADILYELIQPQSLYTMSCSAAKITQGMGVKKILSAMTQLSGVENG